MRKPILAALIVLLTLLAITCDSGFVGSATPVDKKVEYVKVAIGVSDGTSEARTMSQPQAAAGINFYEVVFVADGKAIRSTATIVSGELIPEGESTAIPWVVDIPIGIYDGGDNKAVLFAGRLSDKTLLAIGEITGNPYITINSRVTFTLYAIRSGVDTDGDTSSFKITYPYRTKTAAAGAIENPDTETVDGNPYPAFTIPHDTEAPLITATYRYTVPSEGLVIMTAAPILKYKKMDIPLTDVGEELFHLTISGDGPFNNKPFPPGGIFTLTMSTVDLFYDDDLLNNAANNLMAFSISVPVMAIDNVINTSGEQWYIRGGLNNDALDAGGNSTGGAVLLKLIGMTGSQINPEGPDF
jgi:hypothetical protein